MASEAPVKHRLADDTLYVAHPLVFKPYVEHRVKSEVKPKEGQSLSQAVLLAAQALSYADVVQANAALPQDTVRPVLLRDVLQRYALFQR
jgi:hypothetical protein